MKIEEMEKMMQAHLGYTDEGKSRWKIGGSNHEPE